MRFSPETKFFESLSKQDGLNLIEWARKEQEKRYVSIEDICAEAEAYYKRVYDDPNARTAFYPSYWHSFARNNELFFSTEWYLSSVYDEFYETVANTSTLLPNQPIHHANAARMIREIAIRRGAPDSHVHSYWEKRLLAFLRFYPMMKPQIHTRADERWEKYNEERRLYKQSHPQTGDQETLLEEWRDTFYAETEGYSIENIYNADETEIRFWVD
ncbi:hypothetical protein GGI00_002328, partial [Coemansia sp. RSA 2681]